MADNKHLDPRSLFHSLFGNFSRHCNSETAVGKKDWHKWTYVILDSNSAERPILQDYRAVLRHRHRCLSRSNPKSPSFSKDLEWGYQHCRDEYEDLDNAAWDTDHSLGSCPLRSCIDVGCYCAGSRPGRDILYNSSRSSGRSKTQNWSA